MNGQPMPGVGPQVPYMGMFPNGGMPFGMNGNVGGAYDPNEAHMDMRPLQQGQGGMGMGMGMGAGGSPGVNGVVGGRPRAPVLPRMQQEGGAGNQVVHSPNASGELPVIQDLTPTVPKDESQAQSDPQVQNGGGEVLYGPVNEMPGMSMEVDESAFMPPQGGFRGGMRGGGGRGRGAYHTSQIGAQHMRPQKGRGDKTLVVEKIPEDKLSLDSVNGWFKRFGTVTNVAIDARSAKALVTFAEHGEAHKAWKSEDAVFNNRFVKLFWHRPMEGHGQGGAKALAASANLVANINGNKDTTPVASTSTAQPAALTVPAPSTSTIKPKSSTLSATASALAAKQQLLEQQITEQKSLMTQLTSASAEEKKEIMARLRKLGEEMKPSQSPVATPAPSPAPGLTNQKRASSNPLLDEKLRKEKERLDKELENHTTIKQVGGGGEENTEDLKAKLAKLKAEVYLMNVMME
jgi:RNA-binding protein 26